MKRSALLVTILPIVVTPYLIFRYLPAVWSLSSVLGLAILILAMSLLVLARVQLGNAFSVAPHATQLVTHGLYSRLRNPVYVFSALALAGFILYLGQLNLFWIFAVLLPLQVLRARAEARVLEERFGEQYRLYRTSTWF
jgi:protein-S-isoprenylcysteine O-methyltransferase Ste14